MTDNLLIHLS